VGAGTLFDTNGEFQAHGRQPQATHDGRSRGLLAAIIKICAPDLMRSALVFGGSGQLGISVAEHLLSSGWRVSAVTREGRALPSVLTDCGAMRVDGTGKSRADVIRAAEWPVDAVFDPTAYTEADAHDLLQAQAYVGGFVVASSCSVCRDAKGRSLDEADENGFPRFDGPISEDIPTVEPGPQTYSTRKVGMERALLASGAPVSILRPCAIYGVHATHPREWWFIKRALDGREAIPVSYEAKSVFHTSSARGIASLAKLCLESPGARILNVADPTALSVAEIAATISDATGLTLPLWPFDGPPAGASQVGGTPWSAERSYVLDTTRAVALGWDGGGDYRSEVADVCRWVLDVERTGDWRAQFTRFARYGYDPFDYEAEDRFLAAA
jgi:nucleoside-diphosphate-sugar epimerase